MRKALYQFSANLIILAVSILIVIGARAEVFKGFNSFSIYVNEEIILTLVLVLINLFVWRLIDKLKVETILSLITVIIIVFSMFTYGLLLLGSTEIVKIVFGILASVLLVGDGIAESCIIFKEIKRLDAPPQSDGHTDESLEYDNKEL